MRAIGHSVGVGRGRPGRVRRVGRALGSPLTTSQRVCLTGVERDYRMRRAMMLDTSPMDIGNNAASTNGQSGLSLPAPTSINPNQMTELASKPLISRRRCVGVRSRPSGAMRSSAISAPPSANPNPPAINATKPMSPVTAPATALITTEAEAENANVVRTEPLDMIVREHTPVAVSPYRVRLACL